MVRLWALVRCALGVSLGPAHRAPGLWGGGAGAGYVVKWKGYKGKTWEPWSAFFPNLCDEFLEFLAKSKTTSMDLMPELRKSPFWPQKP